LADGDRARITSASNADGVWDLQNGRQVPMEGALKAIEGIRPGRHRLQLGSPVGCATTKTRWAAASFVQQRLAERRCRDLEARAR